MLNGSITALGNYIGTDSTGKRDRGNDGAGLLAAPTTRSVGDGRRQNVISGNGGHGIEIGGGEPEYYGGMRINQNFIGTNKTGRATIPNDGDGVRIRPTDVRVWVAGTVGRRANTPSVISGDRGYGVTVEGDI